MAAFYGEFGNGGYSEAQSDAWQRYAEATQANRPLMEDVAKEIAALRSETPAILRQRGTMLLQKAYRMYTGRVALEQPGARLRSPRYGSDDAEMLELHRIAGVECLRRADALEAAQAANGSYAFEPDLELAIA